MGGPRKKKKAENSEGVRAEYLHFLRRFEKCRLYEGQKMFIKDATDAIEKGALAILESPTGTGKTRSSLLSAMYYVRGAEALPEGVSQENLALLREIYGRSNKHVVYACRTHGQLVQVAKELEALNKIGGLSVTGVVLGARRHTCMHPKARKSQDVNNLCRVLVKNKKCEFYSNFLAESAASGRRREKCEISIEDAVQRGSGCRVCPHFYLKREAKTSSIIILPYSLLLQKDFFGEIGIEMRETVLVVDEAHNLCGSVLEENTVTVEYSEVESVLPFFSEYMEKKEGVHRTELLEVFIFMSALIVRVSEQERIFHVNRFLLEGGLDQTNLLEVARVIEERSLPSRIFPVSAEDVQNRKESALRKVGKLSRLLGECDKNSYLIVDKNAISFRNIYPHGYLEYLSEVKSIIAVGGTLNPSAEISGLFQRECISKAYPAVCKNLVVGICQDFLFTYARRSQEAERALSLALAHYRRVKSGGILLFVQSKSVLSEMKKCLEEKNLDGFLFEGDAEMSTYKSALARRKKAIMVCVLGGNFSEGINFNDELCRVLIVCGIPLPQPTEETQLIEKHRGSEHFIDKGLQVVNQAIGRSVRTRSDYSYVVLLDRRFAKYREKLSHWMQPHIKCIDSAQTVDEASKCLSEWEKNYKE
ncbi:chromosome transmission fidelity protein 1 [Nematocida major]|uniref:chromosome transmission fidelity protein 1 n=1 Tax=Nematocida major TaxID=1912982 RepID=UPI0020088FCA|nr:chromosome transmission fidelity protein 1 [Nematocida major]KAH9385700.1 chromosome transmission fidelity protein 1 [Nematocida major]